MTGLKTVSELLTSLGWPPARVVVSRARFREVREACIKVVHLGDSPIQLRAHPSMPENLMVVFGAEGTFEIIELEEVCPTDPSS